MNAGANPNVGCAAAKIPAHRLINVRVSRMGRARQQCSGAHDLSCLAIAALRHVQLDPGFLQRVSGVGGETFDRGDLRVAQRRNRQQAGSRGLSVEVHCASATLADAAPVFGADKPDMIAKNPEQRCIGCCVDAVRLPINRKREGHGESQIGEKR